MPEPLQIEAGDLRASRAERRVMGLLLPYGETGRTNLGRLSVERGAVTIPTDPAVVTMNTDHQANAPVGRAAALRDTKVGIVAAFDIAHTPEGDDLLAELETKGPGARTKLSAEVTGMVIRGGKIVAGRLYGASAVKAGAFPSAALLAEDAGDLPDAPTETPALDEADAQTVTDDVTAALDALADALETLDPTTDPDDSKDSDMPAATAPADLTASRIHGRPRAQATPRAKIEHVGDLFAAVAQAHRNRDGDLLAALNDITSASHTPNVAPPQWVGELWEGVGYTRQYIPLFKHADLTSWYVNGWRWVTKPTVAKYSGNKADVPSNAVQTEGVKIEAERIAGAHDIDRKFKDFGDTGFIESYYRAMGESYAEVSDVDVLAQVLAATTPTPVGELPAGVDAAVAGIVRGFFKVLRATRRRPTFARVSDVDYERLLFTKATDVNPYLEALLGIPGGVDAGFLQPSVDIDAGQVFVGVQDAVTVHEMGGGTPIRVDALDVAKGGEDHGVFGYTAVNIHRVEGLALIDTTPITPPVE